MKNSSVALFLMSVVLVFALVFLALPKDQVSAQKDGPPVFSNTAPITIKTASGLTAPVAATNYPADITVSGMTGTISRVEVSMRGFSHSRIADLDFLLVSPNRQKFVFLSDAAPLGQPRDGVYKFADDAPTPVFTGNLFPPGS